MSIWGIGFQKYYIIKTIENFSAFGFVLELFNFEALFEALRMAYVKRIT